jgi:hypothetical protein
MPSADLRTRVRFRGLVGDLAGVRHQAGLIYCGGGHAGTVHITGQKHGFSIVA